MVPLGNQPWARIDFNFWAYSRSIAQNLPQEERRLFGPYCLESIYLSFFL